MSTQRLAELDREYAEFREKILAMLNEDPNIFVLLTKDIDTLRTDSKIPTARLCAAVTSMVIRTIILENKDRLPAKMQTIFQLFEQIRRQQPGMTHEQIANLIADMGPDGMHFDNPPSPPSP